MKSEYTEKIHAKHLLRILEFKDTCGRCPASKDYSGDIWRIPVEHCCMCRQFVGLTPEVTIPRATATCPCMVLGAAEAHKRSWIALQEKGYIQ